MSREFGPVKRRDATMVLGARTLPALVRPKLQLVVTEGVDAGQHVTAEKKVLQVGTQQGATLQLHDDAVSRIHLQITADADGIKLRDLGSTNGTWLPPGVRINEAVVPAGTEVMLGRSHVRIDVLDEQVSESLSPTPTFGELIGISPAMRAVFALLERVARTDETILITGETGTGKEVCARSIVDRSRRAKGPLIVVDCGAIPPNLLESELFGHVRGAFTGAMSDYRGAFERANGGTVFLDEIGELPLEFQTRLLRAVENRTVRRVGGTQKIPLDIRIIAATNRCIEEEVNRGNFRADLYFRLSVVQVRLPPLREHPEDVGPLARHLLQDLGVGPRFELDDEMIERLQRYRWPGNVRELRNYLRRLTLGERASPGNALAEGGPGSALASSLEIDLSQSFKDAKEDAIARFEKAYLAALLHHTNGNISQAARLAQTDRTYLSRLLGKYSIRRS